MIIRVTQKQPPWRSRTAVISPLCELYDMQSFGLIDGLGYHQAVKRSVHSLEVAVKQTEDVLKKITWSTYGENQ